MSWFSTVGQNYAPQQTSAKDHTWDNVTKALSVINPTIGAVSGFGQMIHGFTGAKEQRKHQRQLYEDQLSYQTRMSNTAYQRSMQDMRLAGLNPILAGKLGGASTPNAPSYKPENKALQWALLTQQVATAQRLSQEAAKAANEVTMQNMDIAMMKERGLSPMSFRHTPFNQIGSEWLKPDHPIGRFLRGQLLTDFMNTNSGKNLTQNVKNFFSSLAKGWSAQKAIWKGKTGKGGESDKTLRITIHPNNRYFPRVPTD